MRDRWPNQRTAPPDGPSDDSGNLAAIVGAGRTYLAALAELGSRRFSLRTLLIAMTLVAVVLGVVVATR